MADTQLQRWLSSLETQFDAAVAREEEEAASDLALSLRQGLTLSEMLRRGSWTAHVDGISMPVGLVGRDFIMCDEPQPVMIPLQRAVVTGPRPGQSPRVSGASLVTALRALCRSGSTIEIRCGDKRYKGRLVQVGVDHVAVDRRGDHIFVSLDATDGVRLMGEERSIVV